MTIMFSPSLTCVYLDFNIAEGKIFFAVFFCTKTQLNRMTFASPPFSRIHSQVVAPLTVNAVSLPPLHPPVVSWTYRRSF